MDITIILCTYNRGELLVTALESAAALKVTDSDRYEVLVVDNNSADGTRSVVDKFARRYPGRFRYLFEPRQGKSHALNSGIRNSRGEVLAFMDDDVTVDPMWLHNLTASLRDGQWAGAGGRILPKWAITPPNWLPTQERYSLAPLALFDLGPESGELMEPPFGTNMAFRKEVFAKYGGFRTDLGPRPGSEVRDEDTEFGRRLLISGERLRYEPSAIVYHPVSPNRLRKRYFLAWWLDKGRTEVRQFGIGKDSGFSLDGIPLALVRSLAAWIVRWVFTFGQRERFAYKLKVWMKVGQLLECRNRAFPKVR